MLYLSSVTVEEFKFLNQEDNEYYMWINMHLRQNKPRKISLNNFWTWDNIYLHH